MIGYIVGLMGMAVFLDGIFSIFYYCSDGRRESWLRNHSFRIIRSLIGASLIWIGGIL